MAGHPHEDDRLVTIAEVEHDFEAEMIRIALEEAGIECTVVGGDLMANMPPIEPIKIEVQVFERDAERARQVVADAMTANDDEVDAETDDFESEE